MADIFISYAREDREYAHALAEICLGRGWTVWWDRKIPVGKSFSEVIESELQAARSVIVVWSSRSVTSEWVQNEAADAAERRILIPVLVEDVRIPLEFRRIQAARLIGWKPGDNQPELDDLFSSLATLLGLPVPRAAGSIARPAVSVQSRTPIEPVVVVPEVPTAPLGAAITDASLLSEEPPIEPPAIAATPVIDESVEAARTSAEAATGFETGNARVPFSRRVTVVIVAAVAAFGILLAVTVLRQDGTRSVMEGTESAPAPASSGAVPETPAPARLDEANVQTLRDVVDRDPKNAVARAQLGNLYFDAERYADAIKWYFEALALNPKDVNVSTDLGVSYYYNHQIDLALNQLEHSLKIDPKHTKTLLNIGIVRAFGKQDLKAATEAWRRLVEIAPDSIEGKTARQALESLSSAPGTAQ